MGALAALLIPMLGPVISSLTKLIPDPEAREKAQAEAMAQFVAILSAADDAQNKINLAEASSPSMFVAGARPFIMWVCGVAFAYHYVLQPLIIFILAVGGHNPIELPEFDMSQLSTVLFGMLGLGTMRTYEKVSDKGQLPWQK